MKASYFFDSNFRLGENLSYKSVKILSFITVLPAILELPISEIADLLEIGEQSVETTFKKLKNAGYLKTERIYPNAANKIKRATCIRTLYSKPQKEGVPEHSVVIKALVKSKGVLPKNMMEQNKRFLGYYGF